MNSDLHANFLWFLFINIFSWQQMWGDIELKYDGELLRQYLEYNERQIKTSTVIDVNNLRPEKPRMYETGDEC